MTQLRYQGAFYAMLPWLPDDLSRAHAVMGPDFWPYGVTPNRRELDAMRRWAVEQGLTESQPALDQIFAPDFLEDNAAHEGSAIQ
jgi:4,5-dihydroxyphthalate decarboxylase